MKSILLLLALLTGIFCGYESMSILLKNHPIIRGGSSTQTHAGRHMSHVSSLLSQKEHESPVQTQANKTTNHFSIFYEDISVLFKKRKTPPYPDNMTALERALCERLDSIKCSMDKLEERLNEKVETSRLSLNEKIEASRSSLELKVEETKTLLKYKILMNNVAIRELESKIDLQRKETHDSMKKLSSQVNFLESREMMRF